MPKIEKMHLRKGRPERFIVKLADEQEFILTPETVVKFSIAPDVEFSDQEFLNLLHQDSLRQAKDQAMRYLTIRPHSRRELVLKMRSKGYRYEVINQALDNLAEIDLIDDEQFARQFIQNELQLRPAGKALLAQKLATRGIHRETSEDLLNELLPEELEQEIAEQLTEKFLRSNKRWTGKKLREKLLRFLQSKGFNWEHIRQVASKIDLDE